MKHHAVAAVTVTALLVAAANAPDWGDADLARKAQNPRRDLISLPRKQDA